MDSELIKHYKEYIKVQQNQIDILEKQIKNLEERLDLANFRNFELLKQLQNK